MFEAGPKKIGPIFHKLHITENAMGVPNNLSYIPYMFKDEN